MARATIFPTDRVDSRQRFILIYLVRLLSLVGSRLWHDHCPRQAAALAYQTVLSVVPLLAVAIATTTWLDLVQLQTPLIAFTTSHLMPDSAAAVGQFVVQAASGIRLQALGIAGGASLFLLAMLLLLTIEGAINEIFRCKRRRPLLTRLAIALVLITLAPTAMGFSLYFTGKLLIFPAVTTTLIPLLLTIVSLFLCYWLVPHTEILLSHSLVSAVTAGILLEALKIGFAFYVKHVGATLSSLYGAFTILPLSMVWIYLTWIIFLFGAELNASLHEVQRHDQFR